MSHIRKLSSGKYRAEIRRNYTFIQSKVFGSKKQAEQWSADAEQNIENILSLKPKKLKKLTPADVEELGGITLFQKLGVEIEFITFRMLADEYMAQWTGKDRNQLDRAAYWLNVFGDTPIKSITTKKVKKAVDEFAQGGSFSSNGSGKQTDRKRSSNTALRYKSVLSAMFKYAIQQLYIKKNPVDGVYVKAALNKIVRYLSDAERNALLKACLESSWDKLYLLVLLAITTGMRKSELMNLRWSDIDFDKGLAKLPDSKNGEPRYNPIPAPAMQELKQFRGVGNSLIFHSPRKPDRPFEFRKRWYTALKSAGITNFRFHDLRHSAASYLVMGGATLYETGEILGHKSTETTKRYAHLSTEHKSQLSERVMGDVFSL